MYKIIKTLSGSIIKKDNGLLIPVAPKNRHYIAYLKWSQNNPVEVEDKTEEGLLNNLRTERDRLLKGSDHMMLPDRYNSLTQEEKDDWSWYRQQLRDLPSVEADRLENPVFGKDPADRKAKIQAHLELELAEEQSDVTDVQAQIDALTPDMVIAQENLSDATHNRNAQQLVVDGLQDELDLLTPDTNEYAAKEVELNSAKSSLTGYKSQVTKKQKIVDQIQYQLDSINDQLAKEQSEVVDKQEEIDSL